MGQIELQELREALAKLPPAAAAELLREALEPAIGDHASPEQWEAAAQRVVAHYHEALKRLAE